MNFNFNFSNIELSNYKDNKLRKPKSSKEWKLLITPVFRKMGINIANIDINVVSRSEMRKQYIPDAWDGTNRLKSIYHTKRDRIWVLSDMSMKDIVRVLGHEVGHVVTRGGNVFSELISEKNAYNIQNTFIKEFNRIYRTHITKEIGVGDIHRNASLQYTTIKSIIKNEYKL